jgi:hypothetical protein
LIAGTARDNARIVAVNYWLTNHNDGVTGTAGQAVLGLGTTDRTWTIPGAPLPGSNTLMVQSVDFTGNKSPVLACNFFYQVPSLFALTLTGDGRVTGTASIRGDAPPTNGALLHLGEGYTLNATPAKNWLFSNWTSAASVVSTNAALHFNMEPGFSLAANFVPSFFRMAAGTYNGLFYSTNIPAAETAGFLKNFVVTAGGTFSGSLLINGTTNLLTGTFDAQHQYSHTIALPAALGGPLFLSLTLAQGQITGTASGTNVGGWTNRLTANRSAASSASGQYTLLIPPPATASNCPPGDGYALITNQAGAVLVTGALADGATFAQSVPISDSGAVPIYQNLSASNSFFGGNGEFLFGWIVLGPNPGGSLIWVKKAWTEPPVPTNGPIPLIILAPPNYFRGYTNVIPLLGSPWTNPPPSMPAIPLNKGRSPV